MGINAHVDDVAQLYLLALEKAPPGSLFHAATQSGITVKSIAEVIAHITECEAESICFEEAAFNWGYQGAKLLSINNQTASKAIYQLGWRPQMRQTLLSDIKFGSYRTLCCNLNGLTRLDMLRMLYTQPISA